MIGTTARGIICKAVLLQILNATLVHGGEWRYEKYFVDKDATQRWAIPGKDEAIIGSQNFWFVTPRDVRIGGFSIGVKNGTLDEHSDKGFTFTANSEWGTYVYRVVPLKPPNGEGGEVPGWPTVTSPNVTWGGIPKVQKGLLLQGRVVEVLPEGKGFSATLDLKDGALPVRFEVISETLGARRRYPEVFSRQYGPHWLHTFDVYYPEGFKPGADSALPALINIHGGGWSAFNKVTSAADPNSHNRAGFAYISIAYRYTGMYEEHPAMTIPVAGPLLDAARAIQHIKHNARELGIDPERIGLTGGSAGGATSAWLAMVDDLADPKSQDPIARTSTRVACSIPVQAQTSLDPIQMRQWIPQVTYGHHAFFDSKKDKAYAKLKTKTGEENFQYFLDNRETILSAIRDFSAYGFASEDDPPMLLNYGGQKDLIPASDGGNATHHPKFGEHMYKRLQELGVKSWYWCDDVRDHAGPYAVHQGNIQFLKDQMLPKDRE